METLPPVIWATNRVSSSETHYSLKEMETLPYFFVAHFISWSSETHYSLKEMETYRPDSCIVRKQLSVGNPLLSERDGNHCKTNHRIS